MTNAGADAPHINVDFLHVLACWPDEEHALGVNLGSVLELMLPGDPVIDIVASTAGGLEGPERGEV